MISAIPIPDPQLEKHKVLFTYDPSVHDYSEDKPSLQCIGNDHYVFGNAKEIEEYKAIRAKNVPMQAITIAQTEEEAVAKQEEDALLSGSNYILEHPLHDTGSKWYSIGSFFLPPIGLIGAFLFKRFKHFRNFKACLKGALTGLGVLGAIILIFGLLLLSAVL